MNRTVEYITEKLAEKTKYKMIRNNYEQNNFSIVLQDGMFWYIENPSFCPVSQKLENLINKEMNRLFPEYIAL